MSIETIPEGKGDPINDELHTIMDGEVEREADGLRYLTGAALFLAREGIASSEKVLIDRLVGLAVAEYNLMKLVGQEKRADGIKKEVFTHFGKAKGDQHGK